MKEIKEGYFGASELTAALINEIRTAVWSCLGHKLSEHMINSDNPLDRTSYYELNRKIGKAIEDRVRFHCIKTSINREKYNRSKSGAKDHALYNMAMKLGEAIIKDEFTEFRILESKTMPEVIYEAHIPFIIRDNQRTKNER